MTHLPAVPYVGDPSGDPDVLVLPEDALAIRPDGWVCASCREAVRLVRRGSRGVVAQHQTRGVCAQVGPESRAHREAKLWLRDQLRAGIPHHRVLRIGHGGISIPVDAEAHVEVPCDWTRLDVAITRAGRPMVALEVCETTPMADAKVRHLTHVLRIPWMEVPARPGLDPWDLTSHVLRSWSPLE